MIVESNHIPPLLAEGIAGHPLPPGVTPRTILVMRVHAFGDAVITLPVLAGLRQMFPESRIEMVTQDTQVDLFEGTGLLDSVWALPSLSTVALRIPRLSLLATVLPLVKRVGTPDLFLDLQRSSQSRLLRALLRPRYWAAFDRFAPKAALDRYIDAARWAGLTALEPRFAPSVTPRLRALASELLGGEVGDSSRPLVCLNPAGCWSTKKWSAERYVELGRRMVEQWNARIVLLGTGNVSPGGATIAGALGDHVIDLIGQTTAAEALAVVSRLDLMVSDDSGLMHLAWTTGVPTLGIFGASRRVWSRPCGPHTDSLGSEDLDCGPCMRSTCARGDLLCLDRVTVEEVFERCEVLLGRGRIVRLDNGVDPDTRKAPDPGSFS